MNNILVTKHGETKLKEEIYSSIVHRNDPSSHSLHHIQMTEEYTLRCPHKKMMMMYTLKKQQIYN